MAPTLVNKMNVMSTVELSKKLEEFGLSTTGSKAVLRERLRRALELKEGITQTDSKDILAENKDIDILSKKELVQLLKKLKLSTTGLKATLRERLRAALQRGESDEEEDEIEGKDINEAAGRHTSGVSRHHDRESFTTKAQQSAFSPSHYERVDHEVEQEHNSFESKAGLVLTFKDIKDVLTPFSGDGAQNVQRWFTSFEETADLCRWSDV